MNKQELIVYCNDLKESKSRFINCIDVDRIIDTIKQLDEPKPVKVPPFVADWIEYCKVKKITLAHALYRSEEAKNKSVYRWLFENSDNQETFALAWILGYEVEKEKRYLVKIRATSQYLRNDETGPRFSSFFISDFTRNDIEDLGFGWVFDCPGIEIEEVE